MRVAAGIGYEEVTDRASSATATPADLSAVKPEVEAWGAGLSVLHVPSGLFAQGHYMAAEFSQGTSLSGYWGQNFAFKKDADQWLVQVGITKNWFGVGNTAIYGEYSRSNDWGAGNGAGRDFAATLPGSTAVFDVTSTELNVWGVGITQNLDAAATTLYLSYRNFSGDITCHGAGANCSGAAGGPAKSLATEDFHAIIGGGVVRF